MRFPAMDNKITNPHKDISNRPNCRDAIIKTEIGSAFQTNKQGDELR